MLVTVVCAALLGNSLSSFRAMGFGTKYFEGIRVQAATVTMEDTNTGVSRADMVGVTGEGITGGYPELAGANSALAAIRAAQDANSGAVRDYTVWLLADVTLNESFVVPAGARIALDLNGYSITGNLESGHGFSISGQNAVLHVQGTGNIDIQTKGGVGFFNYVLNNELTIDINGTISHSDSAGFSNSCVILNGGAFQLTNGILYEKNRYGILNQGSVSIEGGTVTGGMAAAFGTTGTWNISGGTFGNVVHISGSAAANISGEVTRPSDYTGTMFLVDGGGTAVVTGTVDGGAHWSGDENPLLGRGEINDGVVAGKGAYTLEQGGFLFAVQGTDTAKSVLMLEKGAVLQNNERQGFYSDMGISTPGDADRGGAVYVSDYGSVTMNEGAEIRDCAVTAKENTKIGGGAAVSVFGNLEKPEFTMNGGTISGCDAGQSGGAVRVVAGSFAMNGGEITGNQSKEVGAGVMIAGEGTLSLSGASAISGNTRADGVADDVYALNMSGSSTSIRVTGTLTGSIGICQGSEGEVFAVADSEEIAGTSVGAFRDNRGEWAVTAEGNTLKWIEAAACATLPDDTAAIYSTLQDAVDAVKDGGTVRLLKNIAVDRTVYARKSFTLTGAGHAEDESYTLSREAAAGDLFAVSGSVTVTLEHIVLDGASETEVTGALVALSDGAVLYMKKGTKLCNNENAALDSEAFHAGGGAVRVEHASLFIEDGEIRGCLAPRGAAIYAENGLVSMTGGYLTACSAAFGGGIYLSEGAQMFLTGGRIDTCTADTAAGGIYVTENVGFFVSGEPVVKDNTLMAAGETELSIHSNIHLAGNAQVTQTGDLAEQAELYITHETEPTEGTTFGVDTQGFGGSGRYFSDQDVNFTAERNPEDKLIWTIQVPELPAAGRGRRPGLMGAVSFVFLVWWLRLLLRLVRRKSDE